MPSAVLERTPEPAPARPRRPARSTSSQPRPPAPVAPAPAVHASPPVLRLSPAPPSHAPSPGRSLAPDVAGPISSSFGVDVSPVRVHNDATAAGAAAALGARAFTWGNDVFLGQGERADDLSLMGHEVAHVVQQRGGTAPQTWTTGGGDAYEREAQSASSAVVSRRRFGIGQRTAPRAQRLGIRDVLDFFADKANLIPGFRMFTIVIGINPVNMRRVERTAANVLRAVIEFIPGGGLVTQALDNHGIFEKVGAWVEQQIRTLALTGAAIRDALMRFLDSLGLRDILSPGSVWERAKRIFTEPIGRIIDFAKGLVSGIVRFIKDAILAPLARLAEGTRGYDLLKAVLGRDPITGEPVPRNADTLIGGFMKLIGQEEVWNNLKRANAVPRAWAWFQGALAGLLGYVRQIPQLFLSALQQLELVDIVVVPRAFGKVARVFGGFVGSFFSWAGQQVLSLLQIIFEVVAPGVMPYVRKAAGAFTQIVRAPVRFVGNLVRAGIQGFRQFAGNFLNHLRRSLIEWITGTLSGTGIYIPRAFELREIIKFVLSVLGLTWQNIRRKLVRVIGERAVAVLERGFDIVVTLVREGPAAAWEKIRESISNLREMVMEQIMSFVSSRIVQAAITRLVTSLNPAGAFIQAIIAIYNTIMFFIERLRQIARVVAAFIDSISAIAAGAIGAAASRVEQTMAGLLTLVISFLARLVGLGRVSDAVAGIVNRLRAPIDRALDRVVDWIVAMARRLGRLFTGGPGTAPGPTAHDDRWNVAVAAVNRELDAMKRAGLRDEDLEAAIPRWKRQYGFADLRLEEENGEWEITGSMSAKKRVARADEPGSRKKPFDLVWPKPSTDAYPEIYLGGPIGARRTQEYLEDKVGQKDARGITITRYGPHSRKTLPDASGRPGSYTIGLGTQWRMTTGKVVGPLSEKTTPGGEKLNKILREYGFRPKGEDKQADHAHEIQMGGADVVENLWPLETSKNTRAGAKLKEAPITYPDSGRTAKVKDLKKKAREYWFKITGFSG